MPSFDDAPLRRSLSRRGFLQTFAALTGGLALSAACGQPAAPAEPADTKPAETKPAAPAATTAPAAPAAAAPTQAAPAAKPAEAKPAASGEAPKKGGNLRV